MSEGRLSARMKALVAGRARGCCEYCRSQARFSPQPFSAEHILPRSREGGASAENLALSCQGCNNHKYTKTEGIDLTDGADVPLFHPRRQRWRDHFAWSGDATLILGLTPTGRATIDALRLNRDALVNLRRVLKSVDEHPPAEPDPDELPIQP